MIEEHERIARLNTGELRIHLDRRFGRPSGFIRLYRQLDGDLPGFVRFHIVVRDILKYALEFRVEKINHGAVLQRFKRNLSHFVHRQKTSFLLVALKRYHRIGAVPERRISGVHPIHPVVIPRVSGLQPRTADLISPRRGGRSRSIADIASTRLGNDPGSQIPTISW